MLHPLLHLLTRRPALLADHAQAYVELAASEFEQSGGAWVQRLLCYASAGVLLAMALLLGCIALMLWAVTPADALRMPWALIVAPALPAAIGVSCFLKARAPKTRSAMATLREQFQADMAMLRESSDEPPTTAAPVAASVGTPVAAMPGAAVAGAAA